jgi:hypothetical protein
MSVGSLGIISSLATTASTQRAADVERVERETSDQARVAVSKAKAASAGGIGETEEDSEISDRDADGRRPWELPAAHPQDEATASSPAAEAAPPKDPHGEAGNLLDISG